VDIGGVPLHPSDHSNDAIAWRLKILRRKHGYTQAIIGEIAGVGRTAWGNYESGLRRIDLDAALALRRRFGVTLDWIYEGDWPSLSGKLIDELRKAEAELIEDEKS
jgi:transcriptional regulator with XRE-family HTH domain